MMEIVENHWNSNPTIRNQSSLLSVTPCSMFNLEHVDGWMLQYEHVLRTQQNQMLDSADAMLMRDPQPTLDQL